MNLDGWRASAPAPFGHKTYRTREKRRANVFDYIERFYNRNGRHSTIGYLSPMQFESQTGLA
jgi:putative transposase